MKVKDSGTRRPRPTAYGRDRKARDLYGDVLDKVFGDVLVESGELEQQRVAAPVLAAELIGLSHNQRKLLVKNSHRYHLWPLAEEILARSQAEWTADLTEAENLAELALVICDHLVASGFRLRILNDLKAEAWSYVGNCRRIRADFWGAEQAFGEAERHLYQGSHEPMERARLQDLRASLLGAKRDFSGAMTLLSNAVRHYREAGCYHEEGRALVKRAKLLCNSGQPQQAIPLLRRAAELVDGRREPRLVLALRHNLLDTLTDLGRLEEAQELVPEVRALARKHADRHDRLRLLWTEGRLRKGLGQRALAEEALSQVREGFIAAGIGYDVAQASLDLAALYLEAGRTAEVRRLAVETMPIFISLNVQRELLMAWQLFKEAAERDAATLRLVNEVAARIRDSQGDAAP